MTSKILWRYRPYVPERENELEEIAAEGKLWCPAARRFNDPFDLNPVFSHSPIPITEQVRRVERMTRKFTRDESGRADLINKARSGYMNTDEYRNGVEEDLREEMRETPILCFYPDWSSLPMWAHYASSASGYAVGIDFSEPWKGKYYPLPVAYSHERPVVDLSEDIIDDIEARQRHLEYVYLTKSDVWSQEQEERVILYGRGEGHYKVDPKQIIEICFGFCAPENLMENAMRIAREREAKLTVSKIRISEHAYSLERDVLV